MAMFDTHRAVKKLTGAGFTEHQAEALIDAVGDEHEALATKADLLALRADLREEITAVRAELKEDNVALRAELKEDIAALRAEVDSVRGEVNSARADMQALELRMTLRLGALVVAAAVVLAILELIP